VDPLVLIMIIVVGGLVAWVVFLGLYHPRSGADVLDWRPTRSPELEAQNERRRRRGEPELTEDMLEARVLEDRREQLRRREEYLADSESEADVQADIAQMLERVNAGRRRRGEPELTADEYRARLEADA
jgi:hypothetical protein